MDPQGNPRIRQIRNLKMVVTPIFTILDVNVVPLNHRLKVCTREAEWSIVWHVNSTVRVRGQAPEN